jgi:hypothetical protein
MFLQEIYQWDQGPCFACRIRSRTKGSEELDLYYLQKMCMGMMMMMMILVY